MARIAVDQTATGATTLITSYDQTKWNLGSIIKQYTGSQSTDNFIGPIKIAQAKPPEESTTYQISFIEAFSWSDRFDWVFGCENTTGTSRRVTAYLYDRQLATYTWRGFITITLPTAGIHTTWGFSVQYYTHTTGTISATGQTVTGTSTQFTTQRIAVGARIGFGSTDPTQITTWYIISGITNDTTLTIAQNLITSVAGGTAYVIEELRFVVATVNNTATNGGVFLTKGINWEDFNPGGTTIAVSAATTDNLKLVYWLKDTTTNITNTVIRGAAVDGVRQTAFAGLTHSLYTLDATRQRVYQYNLRSNDTISGGIMSLTGSNIIQTFTQSITGTIGNNALVICSASHSVGSGVKSLYFLTTTRFYRAAVSNITFGNVGWQSDNRIEVTPGGANTLGAQSVMNNLDYDSESDRFLVLTTHGSSVRSYYTRYPSNSGDQFDYALFNNFLTLDGSTADPRQVPIPYNTLATSVFSRTVNGITHMIRLGASNTAGLHALFAVPIAAHWDFASSTNEVAISPVINTVNINKFYRLIINQVRTLGQDPFTVPTNAIRAYYRTSGISDNSGSWTLINANGDLSLVTGTAQIQFKFEFQMLGNTFGIPGRLLGFTLIYDDLSTDSHYEPSVTYSDLTNKRFAWRFAVAFGTTVPTLRIRLYDASTDGLLLDDTTTSQSLGTFQLSTDAGVSWSSYTTTDKSNEDTYIRYTPTSLADNIRVRALLTLN